MRFFFFGPRSFAGIRPGVSFGPEDFNPRANVRSAPASPIDPDHSFLYVAKAHDGLCKIGQTTNPTARLAQLRTASSQPLELAWVGAPKAETIAIERDAHTMLDKYRQNGEWFAVSPDAAVGAIHAAAYRRGLPILDLNPEQANQIVLTAMNTPTRRPWTFWRVFFTIIKMIVGAALGLFLLGLFYLMAGIIQS